MKAPGLLYFVLALSFAMDSGPRVFGAGPAPGTVAVTLKDTTAVGGSVVTVEDVASLQGGDSALRAQIGKLDLNEPLRPGQTIRISARRVLYRIQIAGIPSQSFRIAGFTEVRVRAGAPAEVVTANYEVPAADDPNSCLIPEEEVLDVARRLVRQRIPGNDNLVIRLTQPIRGPILVVAPRRALRLEADVRSTAAPLGQVRVDVRVWAKDRCLETVAVYLDVKLSQTVAVALQRIEAGKPLSLNEVRFDRRTVDGSKSLVTSADALVGKKTRRFLLPGQVVATEDLEAIEVADPILVSARGLVKIVAHIGNMKLTTLGEAVQDGRVGQLIRVRNSSSKNEVLARVVDRSVVEVEQ